MANNNNNQQQQLPKRSLFKAAKNTVVEGLFALEDAAHFGGIISRSLLTAGAVNAMNFSDDAIDECAQEMAKREADRASDPKRKAAYDALLNKLSERRSN